MNPEISNEELIAYWRQHWNYSQSLFARLYGINIGNFSRWLNGHRHSEKCRRAIIYWIENGCFHPNIAHSWLDIEEKITSIKYQSIIFCDGDQLTELNGLSRINEIAESSVLFLCYCNGDKINYMRYYIQADNMCLRQTFSNGKDASDFRLTLDLGRLDTLVDVEIPFIIITGDYFYIELLDGMIERGRTCLQYKNLTTYLGPINLNPEATEFIPNF